MKWNKNRRLDDSSKIRKSKNIIKGKIKGDYGLHKESGAMDHSIHTVFNTSKVY